MAGGKGKKKRNSKDSTGSNGAPKKKGGGKKKHGGGGGGGSSGKSSKVHGDIFGEGAMENAYLLCHNVQVGFSDVFRSHLYLYLYLIYNLFVENRMY